MKGRSSKGSHRTLTHDDKGAGSNIFKHTSRKSDIQGCCCQSRQAAQSHAPVVWQPQVGEGGRRLHTLVAQVVYRENAPRFLHVPALEFPSILLWRGTHCVISACCWLRSPASKRMGAGNISSCAQVHHAACQVR